VCVCVCVCVCTLQATMPLLPAAGRTPPPQYFDRLDPGRGRDRRGAVDPGRAALHRPATLDHSPSPPPLAPSRTLQTRREPGQYRYDSTKLTYYSPPKQPNVSLICSYFFKSQESLFCQTNNPKRHNIPSGSLFTI